MTAADLSLEPEKAKAKEPAKRWRNRWMARRGFLDNRWFDLAPVWRDTGDEWLGHNTFDSDAEARAFAALCVSNGAAAMLVYLGPIPVDSNGEPLP